MTPLRDAKYQNPLRGVADNFEGRDTADMRGVPECQANWP